MDLSNLNIENCVDDGADMKVIMPDGETVMTDEKGNPVTITLKGKDSAEYRNKEREISARYIKQMSKGKDPSMSDSDECSKLAAATVGWSTKGFSYKAAFDLYMKHLWIREQANKFIDNRANFYKG